MNRQKWIKADRFLDDGPWFGEKRLAKALDHAGCWPPNNADVQALEKIFMHSGVIKIAEFDQTPNLSHSTSILGWFWVGDLIRPLPWEKRYLNLNPLTDHAIWARDNDGYGVLVSCPYISKTEFEIYKREIVANAPWLHVKVYAPWWAPGDPNMATLVFSVQDMDGFDCWHDAHCPWEQHEPKPLPEVITFDMDNVPELEPWDWSKVDEIG